MAPNPVRKQWRKGRQHQYDRFWQGRHGMSSFDSMNLGKAHLSYGTPHPPAYSKWPKSSKKNLPGYVGFFQFLRNCRQRNAFEQAEFILQAALDPAIARRARQGSLSGVLITSTSYKQR